jgi:hypothetical protein
MGPASTATPPTKQGGGAAVILGVVLLLGAAIGLLLYVRRDDSAKTSPTPSVSVPVATVAAPETTLDLPPIPIEVDAGADTGTKPKPTTTGTGGGGGGCGCTTSGAISDDIAKAAAARGGTAKQCYKTALEGNEGLAGTVTAQIRIGSNGEVCSVAIASDTTGSSKLQNCVRQKLSIGGYPKPKGGCVDVKVPVVFSTQH